MAWCTENHTGDVSRLVVRLAGARVSLLARVDGEEEGEFECEADDTVKGSCIIGMKMRVSILDLDILANVAR